MPEGDDAALGSAWSQGLNLSPWSLYRGPAGLPSHCPAKSGELDPIDPALIACVDIDRLVSTATSVRKEWGASWARGTLYLRGDLAPPEAGPRSALNVHPGKWFIARFGRELIEDVGLLQPLPRGCHPREFCGLFAVPTGSGLLRVIYDARGANARLTPLPCR